MRGGKEGRRGTARPRGIEIEIEIETEIEMAIGRERERWRRKGIYPPCLPIDGVPYLPP